MDAIAQKRQECADLQAECDRIEAEANGGVLSVEACDLIVAKTEKIKAIQADIVELQNQENARATAAANARKALAETRASLNAPQRRAQAGPIIQVDPDILEGSNGFRSMGEFFHIVARNPSDPRLYFKNDYSAGPAGMNMGVGSEGGFLLPPLFSRELLEIYKKATGNLLEQTTQFDIVGYQSISLPRVADESRAGGVLYGGVQGYWLAEAGQKTVSFPKFKNLTLKPHKLAAVSVATDELIENSSVLEQFLFRALTETLRFLVNDAIIRGDGVGKPLGILNSSNGSLITVAKKSGQAAATFVYENFAAMLARFDADWIPGAKWYVNQDTFAQFFQIQQNFVGTAGQQIMFADQLGRMTILGIPVEVCEHCSTLGTKGDVILANLKAYYTATRGGMREASSMHVYFMTDQTAFRVVFHVDGQPLPNSPMTPAQGTNTLSPFVTLETRA